MDHLTKEALSGAVFTVTSKETGDSYEVTTDDNGQAEVTCLELGDYESTEFLAPKGYVLDGKSHTVSIVKKEESNHITTITIENKRKEKQELPDGKEKPKNPKPTEQTKGDKVTREPLVTTNNQRPNNQPSETINGQKRGQYQHQNSQQPTVSKATSLPQTGEKMEPFVAFGLLLIAAVGLIGGYRYFDKKHLNQ